MSARVHGGIVVRVRILGAIFICAALLLIVRLYFVQIVHGESYERDAMGQYFERSSVSEKRGDIYFTTKEGELRAAAVMRAGWRIAIVPKDVEDPEALYRALAGHYSPLERGRFFAAANKRDDPYEEVATRVPDEAARAIRARKLRGVLLVQDFWRYYPGGDTAAQTIGFVGYRGEKREGVYGLERSWQHTLVRAASGMYVNPFAEIFSNVQQAVSLDPSVHEGSIITTIEPTVQRELEKALDSVREKYRPSFAGGIVMDPRTGEIVAIAVRPSFDPNTYNTVDDAAIFSNPLVEGRYELGSIMKPLTLAIGIDTGAISPVTTYEDTGCATISGKKVCNYDGKARGRVAMQEVLNKSLNLGVAFIAEQSGHGPFSTYMHTLGFAGKSGVDLPGEVAGDLSPIRGGNGPAVNYASAAFGQGVSVTPIAMVRALAALAGEGASPSPHIVSAIRYDSGIVRSVSSSSSVQIFKPETAQTVTRMLVKVFDDALLEGKLKQDRYSIAAKTGTAQIAKPGGGYYEDRYLHSFFGYFPAHDARFIVLLVAVEPRGAEFASATLAHPFLDVARFLINYYALPPDR